VGNDSAFAKDTKALLEALSIPMESDQSTDTSQGLKHKLMNTVLWKTLKEVEKQGEIMWMGKAGGFDAILTTRTEESGEMVGYCSHKAVLMASGKLSAMLNFQSLSVVREKKDENEEEEKNIEEYHLDVPQTHSVLLCSLLEWLYSGSLPSLPIAQEEEKETPPDSFSEIEFSLALLWLADEYLLPREFLEQAESDIINHLKQAHKLMRERPRASLSSRTIRKLQSLTETSFKAGILLTANRLSVTSAALMIRLESQKQRWEKSGNKYSDQDKIENERLEELEQTAESSGEATIEALNVLSGGKK